MKLIKTKLLLAFLTTTFIASAQWTVNTTPVSGYFSVFDIHFIDNSVGFVGGATALSGGNGKISKTSNGGSSWTDVLSVTNTVVKDFFFVNNNLGFAVGSGGLIAKTTNGGDNWTFQTYINPNTSTPEAFESVYFVDQNTGYIAGGFNEMWVMKTTDGGANWTPLTMPAYFQRLQTVQFTSANIGYVAGGTSTGGGIGRIYKTINGGTTWDTLNTGVSNKFYNNLVFVDANTGVIGCDDGTLLKTTNAGTSWTTVANPAGNNAISEFSFVNTSTGYAAIITGTIIKTTDGGSTWLVDGFVTPIMSSLESISVPNASYGATAGLFGFYAEMSGAVGLNDFQNNKNYVIYPNPTTGKLVINLGEVKNNLKVTLINNLGQIIVKKTVESTNTIELDINAPNGIYFLQLEAENGEISTKKIIKN